MAEDNVIYIGKKSFMNYVTSVLMQFNKGQKEVHIKARGKHISRAVDVAEMIRNKFITEEKLKEVKIGSEEFEEEGKKKRVSIIELTLEK